MKIKWDLTSARSSLVGIKPAFYVTKELNGFLRWEKSVVVKRRPQDRKRSTAHVQKSSTLDLLELRKQLQNHPGTSLVGLPLGSISYVSWSQWLSREESNVSDGERRTLSPPGRPWYDTTGDRRGADTKRKRKGFNGKVWEQAVTARTNQG